MDDSTWVPETTTDKAEPVEKPKKKRRWIPWGSLAFIALLVIVNSAITLPYYILSPGEALPVKNYIQIPPENNKGEDGKILLATVSLTPATPFDWAWAKITPSNDIEKRENILGKSTTTDEFEQINQQLYDNSQLTAQSVAFARAGIPATPVGEGAKVEAVSPDGPSADKLKKSDIVTSANGQKISLASDLVNIVKPMQVGDIIHLEVKGTDGSTRNVDVTLAARPKGEPGAYLGVLLSTANPSLQTPFPVTFKKTDIGGPSAGLAFTLTMLDQLTPGELTGGKTIAATGTISSDGTVGEVGGVKQKTAAVEAEGAKIFLVPSGEFEEAKKAASKNLKVIAVNTLDEAIKALADNGGDASGIPSADKVAPAA